MMIIYGYLRHALVCCFFLAGYNYPRKFSFEFLMCIVKRRQNEFINRHHAMVV